MPAVNCWEQKQCGRHPGGHRVAEFGVCPAASETRLDGANHGRNGGRSCWVVAGTLCGGKVQGTFAKKYFNCNGCDFYQAVHDEEGVNFELTASLLGRLA